MFYNARCESMKKIIVVAWGIFSLPLLIACLILAINNINLKNDIDLLQKENWLLMQRAGEEHFLDKDYRIAMSEWSGTTWEGVDIIASYGDLWKEEMEKYYQLLYDELNDDKKQWIVSSQEQWEIFTKYNEELTWQTYDQLHHKGSIMRILTAGIYREKYRTRALDLKYLYEYLTKYPDL